ncbi:AtpZ/AtpI family protein [Flammeovirga yaeyamensis]|uniref:AtpZ/AtpI family protein n=1 Tax=Flammeovirga yaeyamensis TaxID=367791 RepID=A0AAX1N4R4_9BACT|nr:MULTISPECIES: AtpZ/AtpI family protein [Flammeovirga]ANQ50000.1 AtpZ/AtpI family protein [Flammeovirga sp. MY04]MBB3700487.1 F0F1-type ATP synthase assembly protein I [Flammeovirga yaeyamensis]NMF36890.1 AtpZ/AtpI family protein [Flammeovirga yaeyamensis]QWG02563.1 AtpZ/AtpI family protein [Flammeovirga yaeyamensis]
MEKQNSSDEKKYSKKYSTFIKYSSVSTEMIVTLLICAFGGKYLDEYFETKGPYFTIGLLLFGVFASLYILIKGLQKISKKGPDNEKKR